MSSSHLQFTLALQQPRAYGAARAAAARQQGSASSTSCRSHFWHGAVLRHAARADVA